MHPGYVVFVPLLRHLGCVSPEFTGIHFLGPRERRLERLPFGHGLVHALPCIRATQRSVRKIPFASVEAESLVYEYRSVWAALGRPWLENSLASVAVTRPLVKNQDAREILDIYDVLKGGIGKIVANAAFLRAPCIERGQLSAATARDTGSSQLNPQVVAIFNKPIRHVDHLDAGHGQFKTESKVSCQHFVCKNSDVLRVVHKLGDILGAVRGSEKMRLRSSSHSAEVLNCGDTRVHF